MSSIAFGSSQLAHSQARSVDDVDGKVSPDGLAVLFTGGGAGLSTGWTPTRAPTRTTVRAAIRAVIKPSIGGSRGGATMTTGSAAHPTETDGRGSCMQREGEGDPVAAVG